jgi:hypothetical protein
MTSRGDLAPEMWRQLLDGDTLERLLTGRLEPDDAPPGYAEVARVLRAAAARFDTADLGHETEHVAAARLLITQRSPASAGLDRRSQRMRSKGYRLKVVGLVVLGTLLGTSGLAAAGVLPDTAQDMLSYVLDGVGISVPSGDHPDSSGEPSEHPGSSREQISEIATTTDSSGFGNGAVVSSIASGGMSQAGEHGSAEHETAEQGSAEQGSAEQGSAEQGSAEHRSAGHGPDVAPVSTPNSGGTSTADAASGARSQAGTDIADERSNGRSAAGSGNRAGPPSQAPSHGSPH